MKHLFVPYELALKLKEKGFNEEAFYEYYKTSAEEIILEPFISSYLVLTQRNLICMVSAPLYQQVIDWFREKYEIEIITESGPIDLGYHYTIYYKKDGKSRQADGMGHDMDIEVEWTYYEALNKAIEEALKLI